MDLKARVDVNCKQKDGRTDGQPDRRTENRMPMWHTAKAGATKMKTPPETPKIDMDLSNNRIGPVKNGLIFSTP